MTMKTYIIGLCFYSEPNFKGNCSKYYFVSKRGNKVTYSGVVNAKHYLNVGSAERMAKTLREIFPTAEIKVEYRL